MSCCHHNNCIRILWFSCRLSCVEFPFGKIHASAKIVVATSLIQRSHALSCLSPGATIKCIRSSGRMMIFWYDTLILIILFCELKYSRSLNKSSCLLVGGNAAIILSWSFFRCVKLAHNLPGLIRSHICLKKVQFWHTMSSGCLLKSSRINLHHCNLAGLNFWRRLHMKNKPKLKKAGKTTIYENLGCLLLEREIVW